MTERWNAADLETERARYTRTPVPGDWDAAFKAAIACFTVLSLTGEPLRLTQTEFDDLRAATTPPLLSDLDHLLTVIPLVVDPDAGDTPISDRIAEVFA